MSAVVFLGPSLSVESARGYCDAVFLPPAKMGDVLLAAKRKPEVIGIIDGLFEQTPAIWHKEILYAMSCGIRVVGGGSMGALRAAELAAFGMTEVGRIYGDFAQNLLTDDDEVAVSHGDADTGFRCFSDAMVNIRYGLEEALHEGVISESIHDRLLCFAKDTFYPHRSWTAVFEEADRLSPGTARKLADFISAGSFDQKRDDAISVLRAVQEMQRSASPPAPLGFELEHTIFWENALQLSETVALPHASVSCRRIVKHLMAVDGERKAMREAALLLQLADNEARRINLSNVQDAAALEAFRRRRGLITVADLSAWLSDNEFTKSECMALARAEAVLEGVYRHYAKHIDAKRLTALKLSGRFAEVAAKVERKWTGVDEAQFRAVVYNNTQLVESALARYEERFGKIGTTLDRHAADLGFENAREFVEEVVAELGE